MTKNVLWVELGFPSVTFLLKLNGSCHSSEVEPNGKSLATGIEFTLLHYYHSVSTLLRKLKKGLISSHFLREWLIMAGSQEYGKNSSHYNRIQEAERSECWR